MAYVAAVTILLLIQYTFFFAAVGAARGKEKVVAPATTGSEIFERALRVQINTLEQLVITLPAMWISATYFMPVIAAILGFVFFIGRIVYRQAYVTDPSKRGPGMMIGFFSKRRIAWHKHLGNWKVFFRKLSFRRRRLFVISWKANFRFYR